MKVNIIWLAVQESPPSPIGRISNEKTMRHWTLDPGEVIGFLSNVGEIPQVWRWAQEEALDGEGKIWNGIVVGVSGGRGLDGSHMPPSRLSQD